MKRFIKCSCYLLLLSSVAGCSSISSTFGLGSKDPEDLEKKRLEKLEVPPDFSRAAVNDSMAIPGALRGSASFSEMNKRKAVNDALSNGNGSQDSETDAMSQRVKFLRSGNNSWLQLQLTQDVAYAKVKAFFNNQEYTIARDEPAIFVIETEWMADGNAIPTGFLKGITSIFGSPVKEKFRVRIETGEQAGTVEMFLTQYSVERVLVDEIASGNATFELNAGTGKSSTKSHSWRPRASDASVESEMLKKFVIFLGFDDDGVEELVAKEEVVLDKNSYVKATDEQPAHIEINERFFNAWRLVGIAIDRASYTVEDKDRSNGLYYVRYDRSAESEEEEGFWASLVFWSDDPSEGVDNFIFKVVDEGKKCKVIVVSDDEKTALPAPLVEKVLQLLDEQFY